MAKPNEISSTERLLRLIRGSKGPSGRTAEVSSDGKPKAAAKRSAASFFPVSLKKKSTIGIDIGRDNLKMVEMQGVAEGKPVLVNYEVVAFENDLVAESPGFPAFFKSALSRFTHGRKAVSIWAAIPSTNVDTRYLLIPKVPKKQIANAVYWSHRREQAFNEKETLFDFEVIGEVTEEGSQRLAVVSCAAPREEIVTLQKLFSKSGFPLTGITIVPFVIQNMLRTEWLSSEGGNICSLFIGRDWSRIAIFSNANLVLMRDIKTGLQSMVEVTAEELAGKAASIPEDPDEEELSLVAFDEPTPEMEVSAAWSLFRSFLDGSLSNDPPAGERGALPHVPADAVYRAIVPVLDRVVRQVERTLDHFYLNVGKERVKTIYISGPVIGQERVIDYFASQLGLPLELLDPFATELPEAVEVVPPESAQRRGVFAPALGLALSGEGRTPNFLHTYRDREQTQRIRRRNQGILAAAAVLFLALGGVFFLQVQQLRSKRAQEASLQQELDRFIPRVDQNLILQLTTQAISDYTDVDAYANRYLGIAVLNEIFQTVPENIRLSDLRVELGPKTGGASEGGPRVATVTGVVLGEQLDFESSLAGYLVRIESSPLFSEPEITNQGPAYLANEPVLRFTAKFMVLSKPPIDS
ncbi:MAG: hypothetical protein LJE65_05030 [Desulfobacteraceae bacterium]|nr:hypothetical protein [Desulfobacteraceae bacterium]